MDIRKPKYIIEFTMNDSGQQFGCLGAPGGFTPNADRMADEGFLFAGHYSAASVCMPSRLAILTGKYVHHTRLFFGRRETTIPVMLRGAGYRTVLVGSPEHHSYRHDPRYMRPEDDMAHDVVGFQEYYSDSADGEWVSEKVCSLLDSADEPVFINANLHEAHAEYWREVNEEEIAAVQFPEKLPDFIDTHASRRQFAMFCKHLAEGDRALGRVLSHICEAGLREDTLVFFTVDHGIDFPRAKQTLYDSGTGIPLIFWGANWLPHGRFEGLSSHCDILPTLCGIVGAEPPSDLDGVSLLPAMENGEKVRKLVFAEKGYDNPSEPMRSVRTERYKYIRNYRPGWPIPAVRTYILDVGEREYIDAFGSSLRPEEELYDLEADPAEKNNLAACPELAGVKAELSEKMLAIMRENGDELLDDDNVYNLNKDNPAVIHWVKRGDGFGLDLTEKYKANFLW